MVVEQDQVRALLAQHLQGLRGVGGLAHDFKARILRQLRDQAASKQVVVIDHQQADGRGGGWVHAALL